MGMLQAPQTCPHLVAAAADVPRSGDAFRLPSPDDYPGEHRAGSQLRMSHLPERNGRNEGPEPLWAVEAPETTWEEPTPMPQARAWFSVTERRFGLPARIASRAAG